ncbi:MAG: hypothetical protein JSU73_10160 [candidate division WOR-3 bacterium]|nr:MAG: hypothetical protein JSU73_10160 [candidate division WOR-3 bacterium]
MSRRSLILLLTLLVVGVVVAQHWEFEQVDTAPWGSFLQMRASPSGDIYLAYAGSSGAIRIAHRDSVWRYEDVDTALVKGGFSFDVGPHGELGLAAIDPDWHMRLAERDSAGWLLSTIPFEVGWHPGVAFAYDTAGRPAVVFTRWDGIDYAIRSETSWVAERAVIGSPPPPNHDFYVYLLDIGPSNEPHAFCGQDDHVPGGAEYCWWWSHIYTRYRSGQTWYSGSGASPESGSMSAFCVMSDRLGQEHACYWEWSDDDTARLYHNDEVVAKDNVIDGSVYVDSLDRPFVSYVRPRGSVVFAYREDTLWRLVQIPEVRDAESCELYGIDRSQPIVALERQGRGVWLAMGRDVTGMAQDRARTEKATQGRCSGLTICRGVLMYQPAASTSEQPAELVDIMGRRVMDLPGAPVSGASGAVRHHDIRHVAPGVYFVCQRTADTRGPAAVRKVVIQR